MGVSAVMGCGYACGDYMYIEVCSIANVCTLYNFFIYTSIELMMAQKSGRNM